MDGSPGSATALRFATRKHGSAATLAGAGMGDLGAELSTGAGKAFDDTLAASMLGSVGQEVTHHAPCPPVIVPTPT